jgi:LysM repeat protein
VARLRPATHVDAAAGGQGARGSLRLTRRGRVVLLLLLLAIGAAVSLAVTSAGAASSTVQQVPVQQLTVAPGDTLWSIAGEVAPQADRRDTVDEIRELNALTGSALHVGQRLAVPLAR